MHLYHGSQTPNIKVLVPNKRSTPGALGKEVPPAIYAGDDKAYCAAHAFPWGSAEGFSLYFDKSNKVVFEVPVSEKERLNTKIYIYTVNADDFELLPTVSPKGHNFWSLNETTVLNVEEFTNVAEAITKFGGKVIYKN